MDQTLQEIVEQLTGAEPKTGLGTPVEREVSRLSFICNKNCNQNHLLK